MHAGHGCLCSSWRAHFWGIRSSHPIGGPCALHLSFFHFVYIWFICFSVIDTCLLRCKMPYCRPQGFPVHCSALHVDLSASCLPAARGVQSEIVTTTRAYMCRAVFRHACFQRKQICPHVRAGKIPIADVLYRNFNDFIREIE